MAVYDQSYRPYAGTWTSPRWRFLILLRYALREVFRSRIFTAFFATCFFLPIGAAVVIYLHHNLSALAALEIDVSDLISIDRHFFAGLMALQSFMPFGVLLAVVVGPGLVSKDLANGAMPLYLSRPFSRIEYVAGKMAVLVLLLSIVTWIPGLVLFALAGYLGGGTWLQENAHLPFAIIAGCGMWVLLVSLACLAASALVKRKVAAQALLFAGVVGGAALGGVINGTIGTHWGLLLNLPWVMRNIWAGLYDVPVDAGVPLWACWGTLALITSASILILRARLRAYEVVR